LGFVVSFIVKCTGYSYTFSSDILSKIPTFAGFWAKTTFFLFILRETGLDLRWVIEYDMTSTTTDWLSTNVYRFLNMFTVQVILQLVRLSGYTLKSLYDKFNSTFGKQKTATKFIDSALAIPRKILSSSKTMSFADKNIIQFTH
jgi:hypothetical protein